MPDDYEIERLRAYITSLEDRVRELEAAFRKVTYVEPSKRQGLVFRFADGVNWNPGGTGAGLYYSVNGGAWTKV